MADEQRNRVEEIEIRWAEGAKGDIFVAANNAIDDIPWLLSTVKSQDDENKRLRLLIRTQETEPPADVPDDQTTEMAVRIAELEAQLLAAEKRGEKMEAYILSHHNSDYKDYACEKCDPGGDIVKAGFVCVYHQVLADAAPGSIPTMGSVRGASEKEE